MNPLLLNFCLMLIWGGLALYLLVFGPLFLPEKVLDKGRGSMLGFAAALLAVWNFVRVWSIRADRKYLRSRAAAYRELKNPKPASDQPKPVLHPEFQFDEQSKPPRP